MKRYIKLEDMPSSLTVRDIIAIWLQQNGFDGLMYPGECACIIEDIIPCGEACHDCEPGYKVMCTPECEHGYDYNERNWHIQRKKP